MLQTASIIRRPFYLFLRSYYTNPSISIRRFSTTAPIRIDMETINTTERLRDLRQLMKEHKVDVYSIVYSIIVFSGRVSRLFKLSRLKIATNQNISLRVMPEEVSLSLSCCSLPFAH